MAALGPVTGLVTTGTSWTYDLLIAAAVSLAVISWLLLFARNHLYYILSATFAGIAATSFLFAVFAVDGLADNLYMGLVVVAWVMPI